ncbi:ATP/GTP-binding protein [Bacteroides sp. 519]|uniref:AAA family ATPase n=1 Tax=Bacteroides sp. 519 TaxID=2302937 RepID=UPI0013D25955|nr:ATP-binding protein [Bacteroides sp. 519]NDV57618.1 hypothetical protein [Bacteroides sp. 519]
MFPSLYIKNYRNLKELTINSLSRINLIAGKNNTGKSSVLEAISLYANGENINSLFQILENRGEYTPYILLESENAQDINLSALASLFTDRKYSNEDEDRILIGTTEKKDDYSLYFAKYLDGNEKKGIDNLPLVLMLEIGEESRSYFLNQKLENYKVPKLIRSSTLNTHFIHTNNISRNINGVLFDNIALTEKEQFVIDALRIIEPRTERITFIESYTKTRTAVVKLSGENSVVPIGSMGDGINRILTIILALVNSSDGYLLIDEFENGLHYTVQDQLWEIVFKLATVLNIQVFATTHSNDCIASFTRILNKEQNKDLGKYIRLDNVDGVV